MQTKDEINFINSAEESIPLLCPKCGREVSRDNKFCSACGFELAKNSAFQELGERNRTGSTYEESVDDEAVTTGLPKWNIEPQMLSAFNGRGSAIAADLPEWNIEPPVIPVRRV